MKESEAIALFMAGRKAAPSSHLIVDGGDDAAILSIPKHQLLVTSVDTAIAGCHFLETMPVHAIGYRCCVTAISDVYAMGAYPKWVLVALTVPSMSAAWMEAFRDGFWAAAHAHQVDVIGGDLTKGVLSCTVQAMGLVNPPNILCQRQGQLGDDVWVTGQVGGSYAALHATTDLSEALWQPYRYPVLGTIAPELGSYVHSATDISDGVASDVQDLVAQGLGICLQMDDVPWHDGVTASMYADALKASDDYGILVAAPVTSRTHLASIGLHRIGQVINSTGCYVKHKDGAMQPLQGGYEHFIDE